MDIYNFRLAKITGMLIIAQRSEKTYTGTLEQLEEAYKKVLIHNLIFGWWSIFSLIWNPMALMNNRKNLKSLHDLAQKKQ